MIERSIRIDNVDFSLHLYDNQTSQALLDRMPLDIQMEELNDNEKYCYLDSSFPTDEQSVGKVHKGDLMLFGDQCLVLFYKDFSTPYRYTKIGYIDEVGKLDIVIGNNSIHVIFK